MRYGLEERIAKNPHYSLRSYSKLLGISPATVSGVLSGKRKLTVQSIGKIGSKLGMHPEDIWKHQQQILGHMPKDIVNREFLPIPQDVFSIISEWYHLAILELMKLSDFKQQPKWIAKKIGVNENQIKIAIERLINVGIIEVQKDGVWIDRMGGFTTHYQKEQTSEAKRRYQKQLLEKSMFALEHDDYSIRDHSSTTMAIHAKDIMKAKEEIQKFRKKLSALLENTKNKKDDVYQLQVSFFSILKKGN